jgi:hypothetical protein
MTLPIITFPFEFGLSDDRFFESVTFFVTMVLVPFVWLVLVECLVCIRGSGHDVVVSYFVIFCCCCIV